MKLVLLLVLIGSSVAVGCSLQPTMMPASGTTIIIILTNSPVPSASTPRSPTISSSSTATPTASNSPAKLNPGTTPSAILVTRVPSPQSQTVSSSSGTVKTFANAKLGIALDYPQNWSVTESPNGARFTSPQGVTIDLALIDTQNQTPEDFLDEMQLPNTRCLNSINPHSIRVRNCLDTISFTYTANLILKLPNNSARLISLTMRSKAPEQVFESIIASARIFP